MAVHEPFAPTYEAWSADLTEDVPFDVALACEADGPAGSRLDITPFDEDGTEFVWVAPKPA